MHERPHKGSFVQHIGPKDDVSSCGTPLHQGFQVGTLAPGQQLQPCSFNDHLTAAQWTQMQWLQ